MMLEREIPTLSSHFHGLKIPISQFIVPWLESLFLSILPLNLCLRIWDIILLKGEAFVYQVVLGIFKYLEQELISSRFSQLE